jgi:hypothetical protein
VPLARRPARARPLTRLAASFRAPHAANTIWALAKLTTDNGGGAAVLDAAVVDGGLEGVLAALVSQVSRLAASFDAQDVANTIWALAKLTTDNGSGAAVLDAAAVDGGLEGVLEALVSHAMRLAASFNAQDVANTIWALAKLTTDNGSGAAVLDAAAIDGGLDGVLAALVSQVSRLAASFNAQNVANTIWALAKLTTDNGSGAAVLDAAAIDGGLDDVLEALVSHATRLAASFNAQGVANTIWALTFVSLTSVRRSSLASALLNNEHDFTSYNTIQVSMCLRGCNKLGLAWPIKALAIRLRDLWSSRGVIKAAVVATAFVTGFKFAGCWTDAVAAFDEFEASGIVDSKICSAVLDVYRKHDQLDEDTKAAKMWALLEMAKRTPLLDAKTIFHTWAADLFTNNFRVSSTPTASINLLLAFGCPTSKDSIKWIISEIDHASKCVERSHCHATATIVFHYGAELGELLATSRHFDVVHIACHVEDGVFALERRNRTCYPMKIAQLASWLEGQCGGVPLLLVLNGCSTYNAAAPYFSDGSHEARGGLAHRVICWDGEVRDDAAALFSRGFYSYAQKVGFQHLHDNGATVQAGFNKAMRCFTQSFDVGKVGLYLEGPGGASNSSAVHNTGQQNPKGGKPMLLQHTLFAESQEVDAYVLPEPPASNNSGSDVTNATGSNEGSGAVCSADRSSVMHMRHTAGGGGSGGGDCGSLSSISGECRVGSTLE